MKELKFKRKVNHNIELEDYRVKLNKLSKIKETKLEEYEALLDE